MLVLLCLFGFLALGCLGSTTSTRSSSVVESHYTIQHGRLIGWPIAS